MNPFSSQPSARQRLLDAANRRFRDAGYEATTAASIAADAGVTERTFFRYFPTKADVLVANWRAYGDEPRRALSASTAEDPLEVVRSGLIVFTGLVQEEFRGGIVGVVRLYRDRRAFVAIIQNLLEVEGDVAAEIARRTGRSKNDFEVRIAANAAMGVMRAGIRAFVFDQKGPTMVELVDQGLDTLRPLFAQLK